MQDACEHPGGGLLGGSLGRAKVRTLRDTFLWSQGEICDRKHSSVRCR